MEAMDRETATPQVDEMPGSRAKERAEHHGSFAAPSTYVYEFVWDVTEPAIGPFCTLPSASEIGRAHV